MMEKRKKERKLTIWSNACSSGQEPYTIAMLLLDSFPELRNWNVTIHATDLSNQILTKARSGIYNQTEVNRGLPMQLLMKYFVRDGMQWKIKDDIRDMIQFSELNLIERFPRQFQGLDIVFLRNVLIYFCPETKTDILNRVDSSIASDGCLFLGGSESMMNICDRFDRELINKAVFYRPKSN
ncbi:Chemotaxis protein methyltransferase Cher2 [Neorhodopirellula pilleata]|uniref:Chemotaxis protein methyltransferase Cher2 n=2 Tax=Neorhodopirellula pilleata TaxID=2714738 RepID=A0A5C6AE51_9BACT|nr:Chemotaxis protein methyltransferase Cher2 [Neorhodopirellula pilleata]